mgnify:CR=1 FL=1
MKHIVLTGGGTAGHVTPNIALISSLQKLGYTISYIGSHDGIEKKLIKDIHIPYYGISSGKLCRYFNLKNFSDPFRVLKGIGEAKQLMQELNPNVVFSKGGFVSVPVVLAAKSKKIPVIIHESDISPGLANKICIPAASIVCCNFPETLTKLPKKKAIVTGNPIRQELMFGNKLTAMKLCNFTAKKPVLMVIGGSFGSVVINDAIRRLLSELLKDFQVIHLCGKSNLDPLLDRMEGYAQFEYLTKELADLFSLADVFISRAGANTICEIISLAKPNLLIPLSEKASRGDQILNARSFEKRGYSMVLKEEELTPESLMKSVHQLYANRETFIAAMNNSNYTNSINRILSLIQEYEHQ